MQTCVQEELKLCSYMQTCVQEELQLCSYIIIQTCVQQGTAAVYIHADLCLRCTQLQFLLNTSLYICIYMHSLVLECALEFPNTPLPMIGLNMK